MTLRHFYTVNALRIGVGMFESPAYGHLSPDDKEYCGKQAMAAVFATGLED
ncbi:hypothetical protein [Bradyrhizobium sp. 172]|uniref:hypothetical protein n=1 Tax=Bradyrhizobium sp. 172 TaxID=2782643 RepID=UPI002000463F|nr:hypothetical protein [Bradyrhizobium sp. 172]UPJ96394.1 hypothetical protein IVB07_02145 [Bradyrhizobium sp. 172]